MNAVVSISYLMKRVAMFRDLEKVAEKNKKCVDEMKYIVEELPWSRATKEEARIGRRWVKLNPEYFVLPEGVTPFTLHRKKDIYVVLNGQDPNKNIFFTIDQILFNKPDLTAIDATCMYQGTEYID